MNENNVDLIDSCSDNISKYFLQKVSENLLTVDDKDGSLVFVLPFVLANVYKDLVSEITSLGASIGESQDQGKEKIFVYGIKSACDFFADKVIVELKKQVEGLYGFDLNIIH